jgi:hypothetical protein
MAIAVEFRIDVAMHDLRMNSTQRSPAQARGSSLPEPFFPQVPERGNDPGRETPPEKRKWAKDFRFTSRGWFFSYVRSRAFPWGLYVHSCGGEIDREAPVLTLRLRKRRRFTLGREPSRLLKILFTTTFLVSLACAQDRAAQNEFGVWVDGQFGNGHAFASTIGSRLYQVEARYGRLVYTNRLLALRYIAEVIPLSVVGDPLANGQRAYAYGAGGSPIGIQVNFLHYKRIQPFVTSGGGFLYFNRQMFGATQFNFTAQLGAGVQVFTSKHHSIDFGYRYHHISNANLGRINPGMDSHVVFVGVSFVR